MLKTDRILRINNNVINSCVFKNRYELIIRQMEICIDQMCLMQKAILKRRCRNIKILSYFHDNNYYYVFTYKKKGKSKIRSQGFLYTVKKGYFEATYLRHYELENGKVLYDNTKDVLSFLEKMIKNQQIQIMRLKEKNIISTVDYEVIEKKEESEND